MALTKEQELELLRLRKRKAMAQAVPAPDVDGMRQSAAATGTSEDPLGLGRTWDAINPSNPTSVPGALARGVAEGATLGFADEAAGAAGAVDELARRAFGGGGVYSDKPLRRALVERYLLERNANRDDLHAAQAAHPVVTGAGALAGGVALPLGGASRTVTEAAKKAATLGAVGGLGSSEAGYLGGVVADTTMGGLFGALLGAGGKAVANKMQSAPAVLREASDNNALKALGARGGIANAMRDMGYESAEEARELGREALKRGVVTPWASKDVIRKRAQAMGERAGESIGEVVDSADEAAAAALKAQQAASTPANVTKLKNLPQDVAGDAVESVDDIADEAVDAVTQNAKPFDYREAAIAANERIRNLDAQSLRASGPATAFIDDVLAQDHITPGKYLGARQLKTVAGKTVNWSDEAPLAPSLKRKAVKGFTDDFQRQIGEAVGEKQLSKLREANKTFGLASDMEALATEAATREAQNRSFGLIGTIMAVGAGSAIGGTKGVVAGMAVPLIEKVARERGPAAAAAYQARAANFLQKYGPKLEDAAQKGGVSLAATHYLLFQKDPEYKRELEQLDAAAK